MNENVRRTETKKCRICSRFFPLTNFYKRNNRPIGYTSACKQCHLNYRRIRNKKYPEKAREYEFDRCLRRYYGMTRTQYDRLYEKQKGCCAICGNHESIRKRRLAVDHIHDTKEIRGLLCDGCNPGLGYFKEDIRLLKAAIKYLRKFQK